MARNACQLTLRAQVIVVVLCALVAWSVREFLARQAIADLETEIRVVMRLSLYDMKGRLARTHDEVEREVRKDYWSRLASEHPDAEAMFQKFREERARGLHNWPPEMDVKHTPPPVHSGPDNLPPLPPLPPT